MRVRIDKLWPGHYAVVFRVNRWRSLFFHFNYIFARANHPLEFVIDDGRLDRIT